MKNLLTLLLLALCSVAYNQTIDLDNETVASSGSGTIDIGRVKAENGYDTLFISDTLNFALNKWIDGSGNNNDLDLVQSNCYHDSATNKYIIIPNTYINPNNFTVSWEGEFDNVSQSGKQMIHSTYNDGSSLNRLYLRMNDTIFTLTLGTSSTANLTNIKYYLKTKYRLSLNITGTGGSGTATLIVKFDGHNEQTYTKTYTGLGTMPAAGWYIGGNPGQCGKAWKLIVDGRLYPVAEGYGLKIFDTSGEGKHLLIGGTLHDRWGKQDYYHYNLQKGYMFYQYEGIPDIYVPFSAAGDTAIKKGTISTVYSRVFTGIFAAEKHSHNRAETKLKMNHTLYDPNSFWDGNKLSTDFVSNYYNYVFSDISDSIYLKNIISVNRKLSGSQLTAMENATQKQTLDVWFLIGQSNAAGQGALTDCPAYYYGIKYDQYIATKYKIEPINPKTYNSYWPTSGQPYFGLENSFLKKIVLPVNHKPCVIKCAWGGTRLFKYGTSWSVDTVGQYFDKFKNHTDSIITYIGQHFNYSVKGIIWFQGETDGYEDNWSAAYRVNEVNFISAVRSHYGNLPFYSCKPNEPNATYPYVSVVNDAKEANDTAVSEYYLINTSDLTWKSGESVSHLETVGYIQLGNRIADIINAQ